MEHEISIERRLIEAEARLRLGQISAHNISYTIVTLIDLKNFLNKYSLDDRNDPNCDIRVIKRAINLFPSNPYSTIRSVNQYIFPILKQKYGFGLKHRKADPWKKKLIERIQIADKLDWEDKIFDSKKLNPAENLKRYQFNYIRNFAVQNCDQDWLQLYGGVRRQGKSSLGFLDMMLTYHIRGESLTRKFIRYLLKDKIIYTTEDNLGRRIMRSEDDFIMVDEGYFSVFNEETMKREVRKIAKNMNAAANRHNIYGICMSELGAATKPIQKLSTAADWIQHRGYSDLLVKTKTWIYNKDPIGLMEIDNAKNILNDKQLNNKITHLKFYCTRMYTTRLKNWIYAEYDNIKKDRQGDMADEDDLKEANERADEKLISNGVAAYKNGHKDLKAYFMAYDIPKKIATKYEHMVMERVFRDKVNEFDESEETNPSE